MPQGSLSISCLETTQAREMQSVGARPISSARTASLGARDLMLAMQEQRQKQGE